MQASADSNAPTSPRATSRPLRLWPGVVLLALLLGLRFLVPLIEPEATPFGVLGALVLAPLIGLWWLFFSRARAAERWGALGLCVAGLALARGLVDPSVATGMQGLMLPVYAFPFLALAFVAWAVFLRGRGGRLRWAGMAAALVLPSLAWTLVRTGGFTGVDLDQDLAWRWSPTAEQRMLELTDDVPESAPAAAAELSGPSWPGFRGASRDGVLRGVRIERDWRASPPELLWRRPVGPGWSSFAVRAGRFYTQEQRGEQEVVACHDLASGTPVWRHADQARFWESNAGAGPRGTPTLAQDRVLTLGATGILNALSIEDGSLLWSRDAAADSGAERPDWAFASSPLVVDDLVIVATAGHLVAYDLEGGEPRWSGSTKGGGYSSPHLATLDGTRQVLFQSAAGVVGLQPEDGSLLWEHAWEGDPIVQPAVCGERDVLVSVDYGSGVRRLELSREGESWTAQERWTSRRLKPYYNDFVVHAGHAYGFDGGILACIELEGGERAWKGGRYGRGQLILLADADLLLVLGEGGELALVEARPEAFSELGQVQAIEGKTWNHPVLVGDLLLVRNAEEMAAFRLATAED